MPQATRRRSAKATNGASAAPPAAESPPAATLTDDEVAELNQFPFHFEIVEIPMMFVDRRYQRDLTSFAERIEERFNPALVQTVALSYRTSGKQAGKYAVIDGQTRMVAAEKLGFTALPALVYEGLSEEEEARIFALLGTERRNVKSWDLFRAELRGKNEESLAIDKLVRSLGFNIGPGKEQIGAIAALRSCYRRSPGSLERTLIVLKTAWPEQTPPGDLIKGLHLYYTPRGSVLRGKRQNTDDERLVRRLQAAGIEVVRRRASAAKEAAGTTSSSPQYLAQAIAVIYGEK